MKKKTVILLSVVAVLALGFVYMTFFRGESPVAPAVAPETERAAQDLTRKIQEANKNVPKQPEPTQPIVPGSGRKAFGGPK
jgi:hypothetical protein